MELLKLKHRRPTRWFHWLNFPLLAMMGWSGLLIYWANDIYRIGIGRYTLFKMFPRSFYDAFHIDHRLAEGMAWHFFVQWFFFLNGVAYVLYTFFSGEWRELVPGRRAFREAWPVVLHDLHLSAKAPSHGKFNAVQKITYTAIVFCGVLSTLTGYALYKPVQLSWLRRLFGGYEWARFIHFWLLIGYAIFFVIHLVQVARAGWNNFRSMVMGYEVE